MSLTGGKRKANKSLKAWVTFVKKVQKQEKLSYKDAIHRAKVRKDKGEKWMIGGTQDPNYVEPVEVIEEIVETMPTENTENPENAGNDVNNTNVISKIGGRRSRRTMHRSSRKSARRTARRSSRRASRRH